jgi:hypothetical protein
VVVEVDGLGMAVRRRHGQPFRDPVDRDDPTRAEHPGTLNRELPHRTASPDPDRVSRVDAGVFRRHVAGGEDVGEKQHLFVAESGRNLERADIGEGHPQVLRLAAGETTEHVGITQQARGRLAHGLACHVRVRV